MQKSCGTTAAFLDDLFYGGEHLHADVRQLLRVHLVGVLHPVGIRTDDRRGDDFHDKPVVWYSIFLARGLVQHLSLGTGA